MTSQAVQSARPLSGRIWPFRPRRVKNVIWEKERIILNKHAVTCSRHLAKAGNFRRKSNNEMENRI